VAGIWTWTGVNNFTSSQKDITFNNIKVNKAGTYLVKFAANGVIYSQTFSVNVVKKVFESVNKIVVGDYYIKKRDTGLYWTNTQVSPSSNPGGKPELRELNSVTNPLAQVWTLSLDGGYYKIISAADGRYVNEKGNFGTNSYYQDWNTYNIYNDEDLNCAIQITQKAATQERGAWFFQWNASGGISYTTNTEIDETKDLVFTFIPYNLTSVDKALTGKSSVWTTNGGVFVKTEKVSNVLIYDITGKLLKSETVYNTNFISLSKGIYFIKISQGDFGETNKIIIF
jgi:hypothetical protein